MELNKEQQRAVKHKDGPLLIFAGAGSGKTRVITNRIVHLIRSHKVSPANIVALSFTNKSAKELKERIKKMLSRTELKGMELSTFHSLGLKICKEHLNELGYTHPFLLSAPRDLESLLQEILKQKKIPSQDIKLNSLVSRISIWKNSGYSENNHPNTEYDALVAMIFESYEKRLKSENSLDFDDLILKPIEILKTNPTIKAKYEKKFKYIMIDEFQDTNSVQYEFIKLLLGKNTNLCVVGDDDQSIYGFRGSNKDLILNFENDFTNTTTIKLLQNYRSTTQILKLANSLISKNENRREKELWSNIVSSERILYKEETDENEEASFVAGKIKELVLKDKIPFGEIAVLFRTNYQSRPFEMEFRMSSIPFKLIGAYNFFDRKEVKDLLSYLRVIANHRDDLSLLRILNYPKRGLGSTTRTRIQEKASELEVSVWEVLLRICESPDFLPELKKASKEIYEFVELIQKYQKEFYQANKMTKVFKDLIAELNFEKEIISEETIEKVVQARMYNVSELVNMLSYFENEWEEESKPKLFDFLIRVTLYTDDESVNEDSTGKVQLMTMHLSKGLEFSAVFLVGVEDGTLPSSRSLEEKGLEEERRLFYVGITRAKRKLFLSRALNRKKFGDTVPTLPSRFLQELDEETLDKPDYREYDEDEFLLELEKLKVVET
ncbi:MAG: 3'-5' exonuclease [Leptospiraceae bacterium]|nr:3'-5' exonuclease [Leptospiraceae bacterium]